MASQERKHSLTHISGEDLSAAQYRFMKLDGGKVVQQDTAGASCIGVLQTPVSAADRAAEVSSGDGQVNKIVAGAAIAADAKITTDAEGRAITAASGQHVQGVALTAAAAAGELVEVQLGSEHILA